MSDTPLASARNPRALAEIILGHRIDWSTADEHTLLEEVLQTPYEQLFDPRYDSPVHLGITIGEKGEVIEEAPRFLRYPAKASHDGSKNGGDVNDAERFPDLHLGNITHVADLKQLIGGSIEDAPLRRFAPSRAGGWTIEIGQLPALREALLATVFDQSVLSKIWSRRFIDTGWTPSGGQWADIGSFFREAAEYFDPIQSGLADCWLVSAMSSIAWAMPYTYSQRSRATGTNNQSFVNLIELTDPSNGNKLRYELTDETVVYSGTTTPIYSHSSEDGELWPAIVEKAFANWRRNTNVDHPDLTALNYGDCVWASAAITARKPHYTNTAGTSATDLIHLVKSHSMSYRTFDPMTAWTYSSGDRSPDHVDYSNANLVANHCYSVLGWTHGSDILRSVISDRATSTNAVALKALVNAAGAGAGALATGFNADSVINSVVDNVDIDSIVKWYLDRDYIVLRNPWGYCEATSGQLHGTIAMRDVSFWRSIDLGVSDGVFAIDFDTFKKYFAGIGVAL